MKNRIRRSTLFSFFTRAELENHYRKMAQKGWMIESISNFSETYRKIEPADLHFCITYFPGASSWDTEPSEKQQDYYDFCAHTGWQLACTWDQMQVFYSTHEASPPLETDPVMQVETLHAACKRGFLPNCFLALALGLAIALFFAVNIFINPVKTLAKSTHLSLAAESVFLLIFGVIELIIYFFWLFKARKAAQQGVFKDIPGTKALRYFFKISAIAVLLFYFANHLFAGDSFDALFTLATIPIIIGMVYLLKIVPEELKKYKVSNRANKFATVCICTVFGAAAAALLAFVCIGLATAGYFDTEYDPVPLCLSDLLEIDNDDYRSNDEFLQSLLLTEHIVEQNGKTDVPGLQYRIITVKATFLYDWCKQQLLNEKYVLQDGGPWAAEVVYCAENAYLLCYQDRFVEIQFGWNPTADQIAIAAEKLSP